MLKDIDISYNANSIRKMFGEDENSPIDVFTLLENQKDFTIVMIPMNDHISGLCIKDGDNKIIAINSSLSYGRQRFTLAHELCHIYFHNIDSEYYLCRLDLESKHEPNEIEANIFASFFIAPYGSFKLKAQELITAYGRIDIYNVVYLEQYFGMSHIATLVRLKKENFISKEDYDLLSIISPIRYAEAKGYSDKLYLKTNQKTTFGKYIRSVNELFEQKNISAGKYEEYLMEAFREDLVYGDNDRESSPPIID